MSPGCGPPPPRSTPASGSSRTGCSTGKTFLYTVSNSLADPDPGSGAFLTPRSGIRNSIRVISHRMLNRGKYSLYAVSWSDTSSSVSDAHNVDPDPAFQGESDPDLGFAIAQKVKFNIFAFYNFSFLSSQKRKKILIQEVYSFQNQKRLMHFNLIANNYVSGFRRANTMRIHGGSGAGTLLLGSELHGNAIFVIADTNCKIKL
jgi:hypothetical protein